MSVRYSREASAKRVTVEDFESLLLHDLGERAQMREVVIHDEQAREPSLLPRRHTAFSLANEPTAHDASVRGLLSVPEADEASSRGSRAHFRRPFIRLPT